MIYAPIGTQHRSGVSPTTIQGKSTMCLGSTALWLVRVYSVVNGCSVTVVSFRFWRQLRRLFGASGKMADGISMFEGEFVVEWEWGHIKSARNRQS